MTREDAFLYRPGFLERHSQQSPNHISSTSRPVTETLLYRNRILLTVGFCIFLICIVFPCLAAVQEETLTLSTEQKAALANAETWKVLVQADYGKAKQYEGLPVAEDCRRLLQHGGWQVVNAEATSFDALLEIHVQADPRLSSYLVGGSRYDTVHIETSGQIKLHDRQIAILPKTEYTHDAYSDGLSGLLAREPDGAPFALAYYFHEKFFNQLLSVLYQVRGFTPISSAISDPDAVKDRQMNNWTLRGVALNAIRFAGETKKDHFADDLKGVLLANEEWLLRKYAAEALGRLGYSGAVEPLCQMLLVDKKEQVRQASAQALGELGHAEALEALCQALATDEENDVRKAAAVSLGKLGGQTAVKVLVAAFRSENAAFGDVTDSLHKLGWQPKSIADRVLFLLAKGDSHGLKDEQRVRQLQTLGDNAIPHLIEALEHPVSEVSRRSLFCLGRLKCKAAVEPISNVLLGKENWRLREQAAQALGQIGEAKAHDALSQALLMDTDADVRAAAADALGKIGDVAVTDSLIQALIDKSEKVRVATFKTLEALNWKPTTTKEKVWSWISRSKPDEVLSFGQEAAPFVLELLERDNSSIQSKAMQLAGKLKLAEAIEPISKFIIGDGSSRFRAEAARALGQIGRAEAQAALSRALLNDKEKDVRAAAAEAMGKLNEPECIPLLLNTLDDEDVGVRKAVVQSLGVYGGDDVVKTLSNRFKQETDADVKQMIFEALMKLKVQTDDLPFAYTARKLAEEKKVMELKTRLKQQPLDTLVELLKIDNRVLTNAAGFELMRRTEQYDLGTDYKKWKQWLDENAPNDQPK